MSRTVGPGDRPTAAEVVLQVYRDVEEADKLHLCVWRDNTVRRERVSYANLAKTRRLLGENAYALCRRRKLSTCWTDDPRRAIAAALPTL
ncbi:DUF6037 family protein [Xanthomonas axonopodis pv. poinsettiicola]|uniref:DUF6037 family protein n=1 Tax=Xanthomonas TaxID=338 RepID=UPI001E3D86F2|nr:DUF6037 family protein [Xanthomonas codiaei]